MKLSSIFADRNREGCSTPMRLGEKHEELSIDWSKLEGLP